MEHICKLKNLETSRPESNSDLTDEGIAKLPGLPKLTALDLRAVDIGDPGMKALASLKALRELNLSDGRFTDQGLANLSKLSHLERLETERVKITDAGIESLSGITSLRALNLDYTLRWTSTSRF